MVIVSTTPAKNLMFKIITIPDDAEFDVIEQLGSRTKFWYTHEGNRCLFKVVRPDTGENWSEKVSSNLCELLGIPHATYELAVWRGMKGVLSPNFVPNGGRLVHGAETRRIEVEKRELLLGIRGEG